MLVDGALTTANAASGSVMAPPAGSTVTIVARASNTAGSSTATATAVVTAAATVPGVVQSLVVGGVTSSTVALSWAAPLTDGGSPITDYRVEYRVAGGTWAVFADGTRPAVGATVTGLLPTTAYEFRVSALNSVGAGPSSGVSGTTIAAPVGFSDTFTRGASVTSLGSPESGGGVWVASGTFGIDGQGQAYRVSQAGESYRSHAYAAHGLTGGGKITAEITAASNYATGVTLVTDAGNFLIVTDEGEVYRWANNSWSGGTVAGGVTPRSTSPTVANPEVVEVTWSTTALTVKRNGTVITTVNDAQIVAAAMASVGAGIWVNHPDVRFTSFTVGQ